MMMTITPVQSADLPRIADLYQQAFPEALQAVFGRPRIPSSAVEDVLAAPYDFEPQGFLAARSDTQLVGFIIVSRDLATLSRSFLLGGKLWRLFAHWIFGRYRGLGIGFLPRLGRAWWAYRLGDRHPLAESPLAQILSIVVDRPFQGRGIGKALSERALAYLKTTSARVVRLEVDHANAASIGLFKKLGFREHATIQSPRGPAIVMVQRLK